MSGALTLPLLDAAGRPCPVAIAAKVVRVVGTRTVYADLPSTWAFFERETKAEAEANAAFLAAWKRRLAGLSAAASVAQLTAEHDRLYYAPGCFERNLPECGRLKALLAQLRPGMEREARAALKAHDAACTWETIEGQVDAARRAA